MLVAVHNDFVAHSPSLDFESPPVLIVTFICLLLLCPKNSTSLDHHDVKFLPQIKMQKYKSMRGVCYWHLWYRYSPKYAFYWPQNIWKVFYVLSPHTNCFLKAWHLLTSNFPSMYVYIHPPVLSFPVLNFWRAFWVQEFRGCGRILFTCASSVQSACFCSLPLCLSFPSSLDILQRKHFSLWTSRSAHLFMYPCKYSQS